ncbi:helix-turn-helix domain-containing protein [Mesorhizobium australicum]|uniref:hypothetical protein n=1 Tax=Mesorhizobium australicum TaxID=536018 RepID=UPI003339BC60
MPAKFDPLQKPAPPRSGQRKSFAKAEALPLEWPSNAKDRGEAFRTWHDEAMEILHREKRSFRLMALIGRFLNWETGTFWATNDTLAACGGGCSEKTIRREVKEYCDLGVLMISRHWRKTSAGKFRKRRTLRPSLPKAPEGKIHADHSCPDDADASDGFVRTTCVQNMRTCSGPFTIEKDRKAGEVAAGQMGSGGKWPDRGVGSSPSGLVGGADVSRLAHTRDPSEERLAAFEAAWRNSQKGEKS